MPDPNDRLSIVLVRRGPRAAFRRHPVPRGTWNRLLRLTTPPRTLPDLGAAELVLGVDWAAFHAADTGAVAEQLLSLLEGVRSRQPFYVTWTARIALDIDRDGDAVDAAIHYREVNAAEMLGDRDVEAIPALAAFLAVGGLTLRRARLRDAGSVTI